MSQKDTYAVCIGKTACNAIQSCWNQRDLTSIDCQKQMNNGIVACQVRFNLIFIKIHSSGNSFK